MLLRFRVTNHRSLRDEAELSMVSPSLRTATPRGDDPDWAAVTVRVAAIYGANAAGKSNLLDAVNFAALAVRHSATTWAERPAFPHHPFLLDDESKASVSRYEFSVVLDGVRYDYGFESDSSGIRQEWLYSYPAGRRRRLFERTGPERNTVNFSRTLPGENAALAAAVQPRALLLSTAALINHRVLSALHKRLVDEISFASYNELSRAMLLATLRERVALPGFLDLVGQLLRVADVGISEVAVREVEIPEPARSLSKLIYSDLSTREGARTSDSYEAFVLPMSKQFSFLHATGDGGHAEIMETEQSSGTLAWISLAVPVLDKLSSGGVLFVDELDASLHPHLVAALIAMFKRSDINVAGGQLIFTTHDPTLMTPTLESPLEPAEIWFAEKRHNGGTEVYSLAEYPVRRDENFSKRYLAGRYGAIPVIDLSGLVGALARS